ncbi:MAG: DUF29 domain-containing protein [Cyanobacteriota bacterium]|jgi:hypothetical protein
MQAIPPNLAHLYDQDFERWLLETARCLKNSDFEHIDIDHLIEELNDLGRSSKTALESNLAILLAHLLKLWVQGDAPDTMKSSWYSSVDEHRQRVKKQLTKNPSLKSHWEIALAEAYPDARRLAIKEAQRAKFGVHLHTDGDYPQQCPFSQIQILDDDFYGNNMG